VLRELPPPPPPVDVIVEKIESDPEFCEVEVVVVAPPPPITIG
jgi:hypothetical protein